MSWVLTFIAAVALLSWMQSAIGQPIRVDGTSMESTLHDGELVWVSHLDQEYGRGDIVICHYPNRIESKFSIGAALTVTHHTIFVKRLVGLPGETVEIRAKHLYVNGELVPDPENMGSAPRDFGPLTLGENEYFVVGDNRFSSHDSRADDVGPISQEMLQGKVTSVIWPLNSIRGVE